MTKSETNHNDLNPKGEGSAGKVYDLPERGALFGEAAIRFAKRVPHNIGTLPLIGQFGRSATSIGANHGEADDAESKKGFKHKIGICRKESKETKHWLRMITAAESSMAKEARVLWQEAKELNLIFGAIRRKCDEVP